MDTTIDNASTDLVVLDDVTALTDSDNEGASTAAIGAACLAAGVAIGAFVVPPVVGFVKSWFTSSDTVVAELEEKIEKIVTDSKDPEKKAV